LRRKEQKLKLKSKRKTGEIKKYLNPVLAV
jgi:hypothetical protein